MSECQKNKFMKPQIGEFYYHFKHDPSDVYDHAYVVEGFAFDLEHDKEVLLYKPLYELVIDGLKVETGVRSIENFTEMVTRDDKTFERFSKVTDPEIISKLESKKKEIFG